MEIIRQALIKGVPILGICLGSQFHLEIDHPMIERWLRHPQNLKDLEESDGAVTADLIRSDTELHMARSMTLIQSTFAVFLDLIGQVQRRTLLDSDHGKPC